MVMKHISDSVGFFERKSTADYVFALGITRFLACASWIIQPSTFGYVVAVTMSGERALMEHQVVAGLVSARQLQLVEQRKRPTGLATHRQGVLPMLKSQ